MYSNKYFILASLLLVLMNIDWISASFKERDKVLYKDLGTLYFSPGEKTRARRTYSVPQLVCLKGCHYPQPKQIQCTNAGWDGTSNLWKCKSDLDSNYALDSPEVICEGYSSPDDAYVTVGSCSLEYSIKPRNVKNGGGLEVASILFFLFCLFLIVVLCKIFLWPDNEQLRQNSFTDDDGPDDGHGPNNGNGPQMGWNIPGMNQQYRRHRGGFAPRSDSCGNQQNQSDGHGYNRMSAPSFGGLGEGYSNRRSSGLFTPGDGESSNSESVTTARYRQR
ncbi:store-operated calcium entry-associated regulatory factor-like isoform X2 [Thrips palmi]|uniref:Store-operated calcium entry-associated regulatory factor n=1 Tax=Thrips palmi TaxID=161013 RepID=A0A6P8YTK0_THRPL|nr:store-operated calcium entry-associated regulatory factor-like isoform X2 [Thrips palmi]